MLTEDKPTIAERYAVASETSNLRVQGPDKPGPADLILAAGMSRDRDGNPNTAGAVLSRLRSEFDQAHAEVRHEAAGQSIGVANERMLVMMRLKSLKAAKVEMEYMASERMCRRGMNGLLGSTGALSWQALSGWLDDRCSVCGGTGLIGGYDGTTQVQCKRCDGGSRRPFLGKTDIERAFVHGLIGDIGEAISRFEEGTQRALMR
jgi:hypothetical protein